MTTHTPETNENFLEDCHDKLENTLQTIVDFKNKHRALLTDIDITFENFKELELFIEKSSNCIKLCEEFPDLVQDIGGVLFDNTDKMTENQYINDMNSLKEIKDTLKENDDLNYFQCQNTIAEIVLNQVKEKNKSKKKKNNKWKKKPISYNKLNTLLNDCIKKHPDMPIGIFTHLLYYITYSNVGFPVEINPDDPIISITRATAHTHIMD